MKKLILILCVFLPLVIVSFTNKKGITRNVQCSTSIAIVDSIEVKVEIVKNQAGFDDFVLSVKNNGLLPVFVDTLNLKAEIITEKNEPVFHISQIVIDPHGDDLEISMLKSKAVFFKKIKISQKANCFGLNLKYFNVTTDFYKAIIQNSNNGKRNVKIPRDSYELSGKIFSMGCFP